MTKMDSRMYLLTGISFSGKSTLARALSVAQDIPVVDPDGVAHEQRIGLNGEAVSNAQWTLIHQESERRAAQILTAGSSLVYDTTAFSRQQRQELRNLAAHCHAESVLIFVSISREEAWQRWNQNNRTQERFAVPEDDFGMVADNFEVPGSDEPHLVYEAGQNLADWVIRNSSQKTSDSKTE